MGMNQLLKSKNSKDLFVMVFAVAFILSGIGVVGYQSNFYLSSISVEVEVVNQRSRTRQSRKRNRTAQTYKIIAGQYQGTEYQQETYINLASIGDRLTARFNPKTGQINTIGNTFTTGIVGILILFFGLVMLKYRGLIGG